MKARDEFRLLGRLTQTIYTKIMKYILAIMMLSSLGGFAQTVNGVKISEIPTQYVEMVGIQKGFSAIKVRIVIDYGQRVKISTPASVVEADGKPVVFYGMVDALNFMAQHGWAYKDAYTISHASGNVYHYILEKL